MSTPSSIHPPTRTLTEFIGPVSRSARMRSIARDIALRLLSVRSQSDQNSIRFPFYHHIFEDEQKGFTRQLKEMLNFGDFIGLDNAVAILEEDLPIDGRYFCITFDDGLASCAWSAAPILSEMQIPAAFYVISNFVDCSLPPGDPIARTVFGFKGRKTALDFMSWKQVRELAESGFTIGSHTADHICLADLDDEAAGNQISKSKTDIEKNTDQQCIHFCPPYGIPGKHFDLKRETATVKDLGFASLVCGVRGPNKTGANPFSIKRDHLLANWGQHQLRYFLGLD
ncbi:MAG: hypothetical protein CMF69_06500 [Magnetovibrio sp.]|nr:hypothetical protein [Magnetovibrio sp.]